MYFINSCREQAERRSNAYLIDKNPDMERGERPRSFCMRKVTQISEYEAGQGSGASYSSQE
jgi:hypothetical protein